MAKINIKTPDGQVEHQLSKPLILGRDADCDVQILDPLSSRKHCKIFQEGELFYVEDLGSSNGTKVNNQTITNKTQLSEKDEIQIGQIRIWLVPQKTSESQALKKTSKYKVTIRSTLGEKDYYFNNDEIIFGREDTNDVVLNEKLSSRKHFKVIHKDNRAFVLDLGSSNGTKINNKPIEKETILKPGDQIQVGGTTILVKENTDSGNSLEKVFLKVSNKELTQKIKFIGPSMTIGRDESCDIQIKEALSSRRHLQVSYEGGEFIAEDLGSSNGSRINGEKFTKLSIKPNELVYIGDTKIEVVQDKDKEYKITLNREDSFKEFVFFSGMIIGRDETSDIQVLDDKCSRKHAQLIQEGGKFYVHDFGSSNGTKVNGLPITKNEISYSSKIQIGKATLTLTEGPVDNLLGASIKGYKILKVIETGDNGTMYLGKQISMGRLVAIKKIAEKFVENAEKKKKFLEDSIVYAKIQHEHLLLIIESFVIKWDNEDSHFLVTEYAQGLPLSKRILKKGKIKTDNAVQFGIQACDALSKLHDNKVFHQNLKPSVFLITKDGRLKLADSGLSKPELKSEYELSTEALWYEAPERYKGEPASAASDIYEFGATMYHALTGRVPIEGKTALAVYTKKANIKPDEPKSLDDSIPKALNDIIMKCLSIKKEERYQSVAELKIGLLALHAKPVQWDAEDDYNQLAEIKRQDLQGLLWTIAGIMCIVGVAVNYFLLNDKFIAKRGVEAIKTLEEISNDRTIPKEDVKQRIDLIISGEYPEEIRMKAIDMRNQLAGSDKKPIPIEDINEYLAILKLIEEFGQDKINEARQRLDKLSMHVDPSTSFGTKVKAKAENLKKIMMNKN